MRRQVLREGLGLKYPRNGSVVPDHAAQLDREAGDSLLIRASVRCTSTAFHATFES